MSACHNSTTGKLTVFSEWVVSEKTLRYSGITTSVSFTSKQGCEMKVRFFGINQNQKKVWSTRIALVGSRLSSFISENYSLRTKSNKAKFMPILITSDDTEKLRT